MKNMFFYCTLALAVFAAGCGTAEVNTGSGIQDAGSLLSDGPGAGITPGTQNPDRMKEEKPGESLEASAARLDAETVALIGKYVLTKQRYKVITEYMRQKFDYTLTKEQEKEFIEYIVNKKLMAMEGRSLGYADREDIKIKYDWDFDDIISHIYYVENVEKKAAVGSSQAAAYYEKNKSDFTEIKAQHILVKSKDMAKNLYKRIIQGENFDELAKKYSEDETTKAAGGGLGFFAKGVMVQEFEDAAFMLGKDTVSEPVKTVYGWHLIKVLEKRQISFDDSKDRIMKMMREKKTKEVFDSALSELKKKYKVQVNKDVLK
ncbi:MAG: peptidylprolyl isomerase [Oligoflexia bacterium]|nr:peptidylprolyl isomerase [Oligoflexia bacterium]